MVGTCQIKPCGVSPFINSLTLNLRHGCRLWAETMRLTQQQHFVSSSAGLAQRILLVDYSGWIAEQFLLTKGSSEVQLYISLRLAIVAKPKVLCTRRSSQKGAVIVYLNFWYLRILIIIVPYALPVKTCRFWRFVHPATWFSRVHDITMIQAISQALYSWGFTLQIFQDITMFSTAIDWRCLACCIVRP